MIFAFTIKIIYFMSLVSALFISPIYAIWRWYTKKQRRPQIKTVSAVSIHVYYLILVSHKTA